MQSGSAILFGRPPGSRADCCSIRHDMVGCTASRPPSCARVRRRQQNSVRGQAKTAAQRGLGGFTGSRSTSSSETSGSSKA